MLNAYQNHFSVTSYLKFGKTFFLEQQHTISWILVLHVNFFNKKNTYTNHAEIKCWLHPPFVVILLYLNYKITKRYEDLVH